MAYDIEGRLLEVCTCNVLCPCWIGEDPDGGTCESALAWRIDSGSIEGVDVAGLTLALSVHIPGNVLTPKSWKAAVFVDERANMEKATLAAAQYLKNPPAATFRMIVSPLVSWIWIGALIVVAGALIAIWPPPEARRAVVPVALRPRLDREPTHA